MIHQTFNVENQVSSEIQRKESLCKQSSFFYVLTNKCKVTKLPFFRRITCGKQDDLI